MNDINLHIFVHHQEDERLHEQLELIFESIQVMANELENLTKQVSDSISVEDSAIILLNGLKAKLDAAIASGSPAALQALSDSLGAEKIKLAQAITTNTPGPKAPVFTAVTMPALAVGTVVDFQFQASDAIGFALGTGALPAGLTLDNMGKLTGTPTTAGPATFSVTASNGSGTVDSGPITVDVAASSAPAPTPVPAPVPPTPPVPPAPAPVPAPAPAPKSMPASGTKV